MKRIIISFLIFVLFSKMLFANLNIEFTEAGFYPNSKNINKINLINGKLIGVGEDELILELLGNNNWNYISGKKNSFDFYDIKKMLNGTILIGDSNKVFFYDDKWDLIKKEDIPSATKLSNIEIIGESIICRNINGELFIKEKSDFEWRIFLQSNSFSNLQKYEELIFLATYDGKVFQLDENLELKMIFETKDKSKINYVYKTNDTLLICIDPNILYISNINGEIINKIELSDNIKSLSSIAQYRDSIYVLGTNIGCLAYFCKSKKYKNIINAYRINVSKLGEQYYFYGSNIYSYNLEKINEGASYDEIFNYELKKIGNFAKYYANKCNNEDLVFFTNSNIYSFKKNLVKIIYKNEKLLSSVLVTDDNIFITDKISSSNVPIRTALKIINKETMEKKGEIYGDSLFIFDRSVIGRDNMLLYYSVMYKNNYFYMYELSTKNFIRKVLPDSLLISCVKFLNSKYYLLLFNSSTKKYYETIIDGSENIKFNIINTTSSITDLIIDNNENYKFIEVNNNNTSGDKSNSYLKYYNRLDGSICVLDSMINSISKYSNIVNYDNECFLFGNNCFIYNNDNFKTFFRYEFSPDDLTLIQGIIKYQNAYFVIKDYDLNLLNLTASGFRKIEKDTSISIFPNPASDYITISLKPSEGFEPSEGSEIQILNTLGECVMTLTPTLSQREREIRIDISDLPRGVYFVRLGGATAKFMKL